MKTNVNIKKGSIFTVSKTDNKFVDVLFTYPNGSQWDGCFPVYYPPMSIQFDLSELDEQLSIVYNEMAPTVINSNMNKTKDRWGKSITSETYKVFESLLSGRWECRSCGAGKINDQPAARIRDIKKNGFIVATKSIFCSTCQKKQYHDILLLFKVSSDIRPEFRKPISPAMRKKIINTLKKTDAFFDSVRPDNEFVIDHKYPSQRWTYEESDNDNLTESEIKNKFQLLTNQTNMLKSRLCDDCCKTDIRPNFLGIEWFYSGTNKWEENSYITNGCYGCPWFDLQEWKKKISEKVDM